MRCLTTEQLERLISTTGQPDARWARHLERCEKCRSQLEAARKDQELVGMLRELHESRARIAKLIPEDPMSLLTARPVRFPATPPT